MRISDVKWGTCASTRRGTGPGKVWRQLRREGIRVARCTVERLLRAMGVRARGGPRLEVRATQIAAVLSNRTNVRGMVDQTGIESASSLG